MTLTYSKRWVSLCGKYQLTRERIRIPPNRHKPFDWEEGTSFPKIIPWIDQRYGLSVFSQNLLRTKSGNLMFDLGSSLHSWKKPGSGLLPDHVKSCVAQFRNKLQSQQHKQKIADSVYSFTFLILSVHCHNHYHNHYYLNNTNHPTVSTLPLSTLKIPTPTSPHPYMDKLCKPGTR